MEGKILDYNPETRKGLIRTEDGGRYEFTADDYRSQSEIKIGQHIDFEVAEGNKATSIFLLRSELNNITNAAAESLSKVVNRENVDNLSQSAKAFLFKPAVLGILGIAFVGFVVVSLFNIFGKSLSGQTYSTLLENSGLNNPGSPNVSISIEFKSKDEVIIRSPLGVSEGTYEVDGDNVRVKVSLPNGDTQIEEYERDNDQLKLKSGLASAFGTSVVLTREK